MMATTSKGNNAEAERPIVTNSGGLEQGEGGGVILREVTLQDLDQLQEISRKTFVDTYGAYNEPEYMNNYLSSSFSKEKLTSEIQNSQSQFFLAVTTTSTTCSNNNKTNRAQAKAKAKATTKTATTNQQKVESKAKLVVVGYLKINWGKAQTEQPQEEEGTESTSTTTTTMEIERIYVLKEFAGRGIGRAFIDKALEFAVKDNRDSSIGKESGSVSYLWLGVWEQNTKAIGFYKKLGFEPFGTHIFDMGGVYKPTS